MDVEEKLIDRIAINIFLILVLVGVMTVLGVVQANREFHTPKQFVIEGVMDE